MGKKCMTLNKLTRWLKTNSILLFNTASVSATPIVTSLIGFVYWWAMARWFPPESVGVAAAAISAMVLLGEISILGLGSLLTIELPRQPDKAGPLISMALTVVGVVGVCVGFFLAYLAPYVSPVFQPLKAHIAYVAIFAIGVSMTAIIFVLDMALIGLLRGEQKLWRNTLCAIAKLVGLVAVGFWSLSGGGWGIYATWVFGNVISLAALMVPLMFKKHWSVRDYLPRWELLHELKGQALQYYFLYLALDVPASLLPVLVTVLLSPRVNAWFYVSWMIAGFIFMILAPLATVLQAASSAQPSTLAHKARVTVGIAFIISILANCVLQFATKQVLSLFGSSYVAEASWCLHILPLAAFPFIIRSHYISICLVHSRVVRAILILLPSGFFELGMVALGAHLVGLVGLSIGWVVAMYVESAFMFRTVYKAVRFVEPSRPETERNEVDIDVVHLAGIL